MLIAVADLTEKWGNVAALNLACELAGVDHLNSDRWQSRDRVVFVDVNKGATECFSAGRLPISYECLEVSSDLNEISAIFRRLLLMKMDYVVVEISVLPDIFAKEIIDISNLVVVLCSASNAEEAAPASVLERISEARLKGSGGTPRCLLVPTYLDTERMTESGIESILQKYGEPVGPVMHHGPEFADAFGAGSWIGDFAFNSGAHRDIRALAARVAEQRHGP
jgi:hypothetical protein